MHCYLQPLQRIIQQMPRYQLVIAGDLAYLEVGDLAALKLPPAAHDVLVDCIAKGLCKAPVILDIASDLRLPQAPIKVVCLMSFVDLRHCVSFDGACRDARLTLSFDIAEFA